MTAPTSDRTPTHLNGKRPKAQGKDVQVEPTPEVDLLNPFPPLLPLDGAGQWIAADPVWITPLLVAPEFGEQAETLIESCDAATTAAFALAFASYLWSYRRLEAYSRHVQDRIKAAPGEAQRHNRDVKRLIQRRGDQARGLLKQLSEKIGKLEEALYDHELKTAKECGSIFVSFPSNPPCTPPDLLKVTPPSENAVAIQQRRLRPSFFKRRGLADFASYGLVAACSLPLGVALATMLGWKKGDTSSEMLTYFILCYGAAMMIHLILKTLASHLATIGLASWYQQWPEGRRQIVGRTLKCLGVAALLVLAAVDGGGILTLQSSSGFGLARSGDSAGSTTFVLLAWAAALLLSPLPSLYSISEVLTGGVAEINETAIKAGIEESSLKDTNDLKGDEVRKSVSVALNEQAVVRQKLKQLTELHAKVISDRDRDIAAYQSKLTKAVTTPTESETRTFQMLENDVRGHAAHVHETWAACLRNLHKEKNHV